MKINIEQKTASIFFGGTYDVIVKVEYSTEEQAILTAQKLWKSNVYHRPNENYDPTVTTGYAATSPVFLDPTIAVTIQDFRKHRRDFKTVVEASNFCPDARYDGYRFGCAVSHPASDDAELHYRASKPAAARTGKSSWNASMPPRAVRSTHRS